jgi:hypothetical protein
VNAVLEGGRLTTIGRQRGNADVGCGRQCRSQR